LLHFFLVCALRVATGVIFVLRFASNKKDPKLSDIDSLGQVGLDQV